MKRELPLWMRIGIGGVAGAVALTGSIPTRTSQTVEGGSGGVCGVIGSGCTTDTDTNLAMCYPLGTTRITDNVGVKRTMTKIIENNVCVTTIWDDSYGN